MIFWFISPSSYFYNSSKKSIREKREREWVHSWLGPGRFTHLFTPTIFFYLCYIKKLMRNYCTNLLLLFLFSLIVPFFLSSFVLLLFNTSLSCLQKLTGALWKQNPVEHISFLPHTGKQRLCWNGCQELSTGQSKDQQEMRTGNQGSLLYLKPVPLQILHCPHVILCQDLGLSLAVVNCGHNTFKFSGK